MLRAVAPEFKRSGVCLAVENHDRFRAAPLAEIFERVGSPAVGLCLDTANSIGCVEHVETLLRVLGRRVVNLHVKDYRVVRPPHHKGFVVEGRPAGILAWPPYELDVTDLLGLRPCRAGIEVLGHRRNSHGPLCAVVSEHKFLTAPQRRNCDFVR